MTKRFATRATRTGDVEWTWTARSGVRVVSCRPPEESAWALAWWSTPFASWSLWSRNIGLALRGRDSGSNVSVGGKP